MPEEESGGESRRELQGSAVPGSQIPLRALQEPENLEKVLSSVAGLVERLASVVERVMDEIVESLEGAKVGEDVASFYNKLRESGVPDEVALEMTREYFRKRISVAEEVIKAIKEAF